MKKNYQFKLFMSIVIMSVNYCFAQTTFEKTIQNFTSSDETYTINKIPTGGYVLSGSKSVNNQEKGWLMNLNELGDTLWTKTIDINGGGAARFCIVLNDGILVGGISGNLNLNSGAAYARKFDFSGNTQWTKTFPKNNSGFLSGKLTATGEIILSGAANLAFSGPNDFPIASDSYLVKINSQGNTVWEKVFDWSAVEIAFNVHEHTNGYTISGISTSFGNGSFDGFLMSTNTLGDSLWLKSYGATNDDMLMSSQITSDGGYVLTGTTKSFGYTNGTTYIVKTDAIGTKVWDRLVADSPLEISGIYETNDFGYIISGNISNGNNSDGYLLKVDMYGLTEWTKNYGNFQNQRLVSVIQTTQNNYVSVGRSYNGVDWDVYIIKTDLTGCIFPTIDAGTDQTVCTGGSVQLNALSNESNFIWNSSLDLSCTSCPNPVATPSLTTAYFLTVSNYLGCKISDTVVVNVATTAPAQISISGKNQICSGTSVTFTSQISNGGNSPSFQWKKNNVNVGNGTSSYTDNSLVNGDVITCQMTSSLGCATASPASSNSLTINVSQNVSPSISILASNTTACQGDEITFSTSAQNAGNSAIYIWKKKEASQSQFNDIASGMIFSATNINDGDSIYCSLTSSNLCANPSTVYSNIIAFTINPLPVLSSISGTQSVCEKSNSLTYSVVNNSSSSYNWTVPVGASIISGQGTNMISLDFASASGDVSVTETNNFSCSMTEKLAVTVKLNSTSSINPVSCFSYVSPKGTLLNASGIYYDTLQNALGCDSIITINLTINSVDISVNQVGNTLSSLETSSTYQWFDCANELEINGEISQDFSPSNDGTYAVIISKNNCVDTSACIVFELNSLETIPQLKLEIYPNPVHDKLQIRFDSDISLELHIYDISGNLINKMKKNTDDKILEIDMRDYSNGLYFLKCISEMNAINEYIKIIKE